MFKSNKGCGVGVVSCHTWIYRFHGLHFYLFLALVGSIAPTLSFFPRCCLARCLSWTTTSHGLNRKFITLEGEREKKKWLWKFKAFLTQKTIQCLVGCYCWLVSLKNKLETIEGYDSSASQFFIPNGGLKKATFQAKRLELDLCSVWTEEKKAFVDWNYCKLPIEFVFSEFSKYWNFFFW